MGLFRSAPALEEVLELKLVNRDARARRELAKVQLTVLRELRDDEMLLTIGVDVSAPTGIVVVTNERIFTVRRGRLDRTAERHEVRETRLGRLPHSVLAVIAGPGIQLSFHTLEEADFFVQIVDLALVASRVGRRNIPRLMPLFYESVLRATGRPRTPDTVAGLARVVAGEITGQARSFFRQTGDERAEAAFARTFGSTPGDDTADEMIDWLWAWDPRCHQPLNRAVDRLRITLTSTS